MKQSDEFVVKEKAGNYYICNENEEIVKMMKFFPYLRYALVLIYLCFQASTFAQVDTVKIGVFVNDLFDLNLGERSFNADFWLWCNYKNDSITPLENIEFPQAKSYETDLEFLEKKEGINWGTKKIRATFKKDWNTENFPFDTQQLNIEIEESDKDISNLVYVADVENTKYYDQINISNWEIIDFKIETSAVKYPTTYGDPALSNASSYASAKVSFTMKRQSLGLFFTLFSGVYVAFFISVLVFFIDPIYVDPRFGLSVGGLFSAVGNKYIVDSILPQSTAFTLADKIHVMTYFFILICIVLSVISLRIWKNGNTQRSKKLDRIAFYIISISFVLLNIIFIAQVHPNL